MKVPVGENSCSGDSRLLGYEEQEVITAR